MKRTMSTITGLVIGASLVTADIVGPPPTRELTTIGIAVAALGGIVVGAFLLVRKIVLKNKQ